MNLSRSGVSATVGVAGFRVTAGKMSAVNVGLPGSGVSWRESIPSAPGTAAPQAPAPPSGHHVHIPWVWLALVLVLVLWGIVGCSALSNAMPLARR